MTASTDSACAACTFAVLAVSHQRLNHSAEARAALAQCQALLEANLKTAKKFDALWHDWMMAEILQREAKTLIESKPATATEKKSEAH